MSQNNQIAYSTVDYVYGQDINGMSKADLMTAIKRAKDEIKALTDVGVTSTFIDAQVAGLKDSIDKMVARLDA